MGTHSFHQLSLSPPSTVHHPSSCLSAASTPSAGSQQTAAFENPPSPLLCLKNLVFSLSVHSGNSHVLTTEVKPGPELGSGANEVFRFDFHVGGENFVAVDGLRVTWNVVLEGYKGVFTMMDFYKGKGGFVGGSDGWFTEELPPPGCCSGSGGTRSGLVAEWRLELKAEEEGGGKVVVEPDNHRNFPTSHTLKRAKRTPP